MRCKYHNEYTDSPKTVVTILVANTRFTGFLRAGKLFASRSGLQGGLGQVWVRTISADQSVKLKNIS